MDSLRGVPVRDARKRERKQLTTESTQIDFPRGRARACSTVSLVASRSHADFGESSLACDRVAVQGCAPEPALITATLVRPPSTSRMVPCTKAASSLARNTAASATAEAGPGFPTGVPRIIETAG